MALQTVYADLHVHLGRAGGRPCKMAAAPHLTLPNILAECQLRKGIGLIGVIDGATPTAQADLRDLVAAGEVTELDGGGLAYHDAVTLIPGCEVEVLHGGAPLHLLVYLPGLRELAEFSRWQEGRVRNPTLSSQRHHHTTAADLVAFVASLGGVVIPAHAFTPFKGIFAAAPLIAEVIPPELWGAVPAVELGLSSDTELADQLPELSRFTFLTNSDAHSLPRIAREYCALSVQRATFTEWLRALRGEAGRAILANYGLDPRLGKYHRSWCLACDRRLDAEPPVLACPQDPSHRLVVGVLDRLLANAQRQRELGVEAVPVRRPPYVSQVPLEYVPGLGKKGMERLYAAFGTEMEILHRATSEQLAAVIGPRLAALLDGARSGRMAVEAGAGGRYGRLTPEQ